jgi:hypothetical protein
MINDLSTFRDLIHSIAETDLTFGNFVQRGTNDQQIKAIEALPSADTDAIATALASAASAQRFELADFDGAIGQGRISPAQQLTFAFNSHADWLASVLKVFGFGPAGNLISEDISIPAGGNVTRATAQAFSQILFIDLPAQGGTNGTIAVGTDPTVVVPDLYTYPGVAAYSALQPPHLATAEVAALDRFTMLQRGRVWVQVEAAVTAGNPVYVRMVESGADLRGQVRGSAAAGFWPYPNGVFLTTQSAADGLALIELGGM